MPPKGAPKQSQQPEKRRGCPPGLSNAQRNLPSEEPGPAHKRSRVGKSNMASSNAGGSELEDIWAQLSKGLGDVFNQEAMKAREYMIYYSHVFKYCTTYQASKTLRNRTTDKLTTNFTGTEIYERLREFVNDAAAKIITKGGTKDGEDLLSWYAKEWTDYQFSSRVIDGIFSYVNRHWVQREINEGSEKISMIQALVLSIWKENLFRIMGTRITEAVLEQISSERTGETVNRHLLKIVLDSYVEIGGTGEPSIVFNSINAQSILDEQRERELKILRVYKDHFEDSFIQTTIEFYEEEATKFVAKNSVVEYMKKVERRLLEERNRADFYLHHSTAKRLNESVEDVLITKRMGLFQAQFGPLIEQLAIDDLGRMYSLCSRVALGIDYLRNAIEAHITRVGVRTLEKFEGTADKEPKAYVLALLEIHGRYEKLIMEAFDNESGFIQSLDKATAIFVNKNAVTVKDKKHNPNKTPELLARVCDGLLRKNNKMLDENELESMIQKMMIIFKYIEDKDIFSKIHSRLFSKRLIGETSASEEAELSFLSKLRTMCGYEFTAQLQKMVTDVRTSGDEIVVFKEHLEGQKLGEGLADFNALVLSTGSWPSMPSVALLLPEKLSRQLQMFTNFYLNRHNGRKLTWLLGQAKGELAASCYATKKIFMANGAQIAVLMLYNTALSYSFADIVAATGMDRKNAALTLAALTKNELLKGEDLSTATDYDDDGLFELNLAYKNKKVRIDLSKVVIRTATRKDEDQEIGCSVEEDRKSAIQACIVRILKMRKTIKHQQLMVEVLDQLSARFKPKVESVKKCIGILMEKDYMKRSEEARDIYEYIA